MQAAYRMTDQEGIRSGISGGFVTVDEKRRSRPALDIPDIDPVLLALYMSRFHPELLSGDTFKGYPQKIELETPHQAKARAGNAKGFFKYEDPGRAAEINDTLRLANKAPPARSSLLSEAFIAMGFDLATDILIEAISQNAPKLREIFHERIKACIDAAPAALPESDGDADNYIGFILGVHLHSRINCDLYIKLHDDKDSKNEYVQMLSTATQEAMEWIVTLSGRNQEELMRHIEDELASRKMDEKSRGDLANGLRLVQKALLRLNKHKKDSQPPAPLME